MAKAKIRISDDAIVEHPSIPPFPSGLIKFLPGLLLDPRGTMPVQANARQSDPTHPDADEQGMFWGPLDPLKDYGDDVEDFKWVDAVEALTPAWEERTGADPSLAYVPGDTFITVTFASVIKSDADLKATKFARFAEQRWDMEHGDVEFTTAAAEDAVFTNNQRTRTAMHRKNTRAVGNPAFVADWKLQNGVWVALTNADIKAANNALEQRIDDAFAAEKLHYEAVDALTGKDIYDYNANEVDFLAILAE